MLSKIITAILVALAFINVVSCIEPGRYIITNKGDAGGDLRAFEKGGYIFSSIFLGPPHTEHWDISRGEKPNTYKFKNVALDTYVQESEGSLITDEEASEYTIGGSKENGYIVYSPIGFQTVWTINPDEIEPVLQLKLKPLHHFSSQYWDFVRIDRDFHPTVASAKFNADVNDHAQREVCMYI